MSLASLSKGERAAHPWIFASGVSDGHQVVGSSPHGDHSQEASLIWTHQAYWAGRPTSPVRQHGTSFRVLHQGEAPGAGPGHHSQISPLLEVESQCQACFWHFCTLAEFYLPLWLPLDGFEDGGLMETQFSNLKSDYVPSQMTLEPRFPCSPDEGKVPSLGHTPLHPCRPSRPPTTFLQSKGPKILKCLATSTFFLPTCHMLTVFLLSVLFCTLLFTEILNNYLLI